MVNVNRMWKALKCICIIIEPLKLKQDCDYDEEFKEKKIFAKLMEVQFHTIGEKA